MKTLSIVSPNGSRIASGQKSLEIRRWIPDTPLTDLLIVENRHFLTNQLEEESGIAVCIVDVLGHHDWQETELQAACGTYWEAGWIAWEISNVRPIQQFITRAKRRIYNTQIDANKLLHRTQ